MVLFPLVADVVLEEQEPPYVMVPASEDEGMSSKSIEEASRTTTDTTAVFGTSLFDSSYFGD